MNRAVACSIAAMTRSSLEYWLHSCCRYMKWYFQSVFTVDNDDVGKHVNCGSLSRDAKKSIGDGGRALRIAKKPRAATATSDSQLHLLVTPSQPHHICQNGRSPWKEVPHPCRYVDAPFALARSLETSDPIANSLV